MIILHTDDKNVVLLSFKDMVEAETTVLQYQEAIKKELETLNLPFEETKEYIKKYNTMVKNCNHKDDCTCYEDFYELNGNIDFDEIYLDIAHPLYNKRMSVEEALTIFFLSTVLEEKEILRINDNIIEMKEKETITASFLSKKVDELLASKTVIKTITINDKEVDTMAYNLYLNYPMSKEEAMDVVRIPQSNLTMCEFVRKQHPIVQKALYATAYRIFYRAVEVAFKLVDAMNAVSKI